MSSLLVRAALVALPLGLFFVVGCATDAGGGAGGGSPGEGGEDGSPRKAGDGHGDAKGQTSACLRYVDCIAVVRPSMLSDVEASVGDKGSCWDGSAATRAACDEGCVDALDDEHENAPDEARCAECAEDEDCPSERPICKVTENGGPGDEWLDHACVECVEDADCGDGLCEAQRCEAVDEQACIDDAVAVWVALGASDGCASSAAGLIAEVCTAEETCCVLEVNTGCGSDLACAVDRCEISSACMSSVGDALHGLEGCW